MPSKRPDISELNKRITFLKQTQGKDYYGGTNYGLQGSYIMLGQC